MTGQLAIRSRNALEGLHPRSRGLRVYVASSVRNQRFHDVVAAIRGAGHVVYDFRAQPTFFRWNELATGDSCEIDAQREVLDHPRAKRAFLGDMIALIEADVCVLVLPAGASSHLELGYAVGAGKRAIVLLDGGAPELMYSMATTLCASVDEVLKALPRGGTVG